MIKDNEIKELESIVGEHWVNSDACMMDTYSYYMNPEIMNTEGSLWLTRPEAVVMPSTSEEVAQLVKYCNKSDLMIKPISTGWECYRRGIA